MEISSNALKALIATIRDSTVSLEAAVTPIKATPLEPGSEIRGEVLEKQPNGRYLVRVGTEVFDMPLPRNTPTGKTLQMTYVGDQPRITFSIPQSAVKGSEVTLSAASRWLGSMTSGTLPPANAEGPSAARTTRLFDTLPVDRGAIVQRLLETVSRSGLFYESHLLRWSENSFSLSELLKEPQGQHSPLMQQSASTGSPTTQAHAADPQTLPIIRQQLELLQSGQFVWHGESWQGQQLEWMIRRDGKRKAQKSANEWETSLKLDLPSLGPVSAKVHLSGGAVRISIVTSNDTSAVKMDLGRKRLLEGMESAGLHLVGLEVRHEPAP